MSTDSYQPRAYRNWVEGKGLVSFTVSVRETDLFIRAVSNLQRKALRLVEKYRRQLEKHIDKHPEFQSSLEPLPEAVDAPVIARSMLEAGRSAGVGPMAAVAGAVAEFVGRELLDFSPEIVVENGGDIFLKTLHKMVVGIYAGKSPLTGKLGMEIEPQDTPLGICTSSGTVGHSLSFGKADAVIVTSESTPLADAAATAIGNRVSRPRDIEGAIEFGKSIPGLNGLVIVVGSEIGVWGEIKLCETSV